MADKKISALTAATTPLGGTEVLPIVQSGTTVKASIADVQAAPVSAGTAYAVTYLNATKVPTNNTSVLSTFDGSCLLLNNASQWASEKFGITGASATQRFSYWRTTANGHYVSMGTDGTNPYLDFGNGSGFDFITSSTKHLTIDNSSNVKANAGNFVVGTAGKGIDFSANGGDVLSQYDEGTWTPSIGGNATYSSRSGRYTRIGNVVHIFCSMQISTLGTGSTTTISGLPFVSAQRGGGGMTYFASLSQAVSFLSPVAEGSVVTFEGITVASSGTTDGIAIFGNGAYVVFSATYFV